MLITTWIVGCSSSFEEVLWECWMEVELDMLLLYRRRGRLVAGRVGLCAKAGTSLDWMNEHGHLGIAVPVHSIKSRTFLVEFYVGIVQNPKNTCKN